MYVRRVRTNTRTREKQKSLDYMHARYTYEERNFEEKEERDLHVHTGKVISDLLGPGEQQEIRVC